VIYANFSYITVSYTIHKQTRLRRTFFIRV